MKLFNKTLLAVAVTLASSQAMAAGFQLNSQSATGIGRAFAGDAVIADNASVLARNPAAMALFDKRQLSLGITYADIDVSVKDVHANTALGELSYGSVDSAADNKVIPNFYYINPVNDKFAYGVGLFSNFGTGTDTASLSQQVIPTGQAAAPYLPTPMDILGNTEVTTINLNLSASYRFNEHFSVGAGVDIIYGEGSLTRNGQLPTPAGIVQQDLVDIDADGVGFGGIVGAVYEINANHRFGMSYRFSPEFEASGDNIYAGTEYGDINIPLPDIFQVAGFHQLTDKFAVHYTAQFTSWGDFDEISLDGLNEELKEYAWEDSWLFSIGATYTLNQDWTLRAGYMHDQGVVDNISSLSIPDSDRNWYTAGATYNLSANSSIDFAVAFVRGEDVNLTEDSKVYGLLATQLPIFTEGGAIHATTRSDAVYYSMQYSYKF